MISMTIIAAYSIFNSKRRYVSEIENFRQEEMQKIQKNIKDLVDIAYNMVAESHQSSKNIESLRKIYLTKDSTNFNSEVLSKNILKITVENLRMFRYSEGSGYIWINDIRPPYIVIMHPTRPEIEGRSNIFYIGKENKKNVYDAFAEICNKSGAGFLQYDFYKPGETEMSTKISYIRLYEPLGWVIGTGIYIDNIDKVIISKSAELDEHIQNTILFTFVIGLIINVISGVLLYFFGGSITSIIFKIEEKLYAMAKGKRVSKLNEKRKDEIGEIIVSTNALIDGMDSYSAFAVSIGKGNLNADFNALSEEDELGNSLLDMRKSLKEANSEEEKRHKETERRNWMTEGLAKFGDILRQNNNNIEKLSHAVISELVRYLKANQGGVFFYNDENKNDQHLEVIAAFAFGNKRFFKKRIELGDGLAGTCALEKETIYITKIPDNYVEITSGLGTATPTCLLIVPLKIEEKLLGVMEIASFQEISPYEIEFVEKISESFASTLYSVKINEQTTHLLEISRRQAEEKAAQEHEMREKFEELRMLKEKYGLT